MQFQPVPFLDDSLRGAQRPVVLVLGTGDIASAIGRMAFMAGWGAVLLRDGGVPVLRRGMAFDDAMEEGLAELDGIWAVPAMQPEALPVLSRSREALVVAACELAVVAAACPDMASVLIDARMRKYAQAADLRPLAACTIGIGPGFVADGNVHIAVETLPGQEGALIVCGPTAIPTGRAEPLGGAGEERFITAPSAGPWRPLVALGAQVDAGAVVGLLGRREVVATIDGRVRGVVRGAAAVARGCKLMEIDPRRDAPWRGVPTRAQRIATGVRAALDALVPLRLAIGAF